MDDKSSITPIALRGSKSRGIHPIAWASPDGWLGIHHGNRSPAQDPGHSVPVQRIAVFARKCV